MGDLFIINKYISITYDDIINVYNSEFENCPRTRAVISCVLRKSYLVNESYDSLPEFTDIVKRRLKIEFKYIPEYKLHYIVRKNYHELKNGDIIDFKYCGIMLTNCEVSI